MVVDKHKRLVVYTCVIDGYDVVLPPVGVQAGIDFILYTNDPTLMVRGWNTLVIDKKPDQPAGMVNRQYKFFPHRYLEEYDVSLYVDGNIRIIEDLTPLFADFIGSDAGLGLFVHPSRSTVEQEIDACDQQGVLGDRDVADRQLEHYKGEGFADDVGLTENNVIFRNHHDQSVRNAMDLWWEQVNTHSRRDQLSLGYVRWKLDVPTIIYPWNARKGDRYFYRYKHLSISRVENWKNMIKARRYDNRLYSLLFSVWMKLKSGE